MPSIYAITEIDLNAGQTTENEKPAVAGGRFAARAGL
jgi:hypothetical protein